MQTEYISNNSSRRLILLFLGWGMDAACVSHLHRAGFDILAVWDYTGLEHLDVQTEAMRRLGDRCSGYDEVVVMAWSFGVRIATGFLTLYEYRLPVTLTIAVNGTPMHVDDAYGIPKAIFDGTLANLSDRTVAKFRRRMFVSSSQFADFMENAPNRSTENLREELLTFSNIPPADSADMWNVALIADTDLVIPTQNQWNYWGKFKSHFLPNCGHFPDLQEIIEKYIVDKALVAQRFASARETYRANASVQKRVASKLWQRTERCLEEVSASAGVKVMEIGAGSGLLTDLYYRHFPDSEVELWDLTDAAPDMPTGIKWISGDAEIGIRDVADGSIALIISSSTLQWFNSPERFLTEAYSKLQPGGVAAFAMYAEGTFCELASLTGISLRYPTAESLERAVPSGAELLMLATETETEEFSDTASLLKHLKSTGVNAVERPSPSAALKIARHYPVTEQGRYALTYRPLYLIFRRPAD